MNKRKSPSPHRSLSRFGSHLFFCASDQMLVAAQGSCVASMLGPLLGVQSGFFSTAEGRLRSHLKAVQKAHGEKLTKEEKLKVLMKNPLVAMDLLPNDMKKRAYEAARRRAIPLYRQDRSHTYR